MTPCGSIRDCRFPSSAAAIITDEQRKGSAAARKTRRRDRRAVLLTRSGPDAAERALPVCTENLKPGSIDGEVRQGGHVKL
jgi:hypothetical protein